MGDVKHKWLVEIASQFGMNVKQFAESIGYSRQALYQASCGMSRLDKRRLAVAMYKLDVMNEKLLEAEKAAAVKRFEDRRKLIESLTDRLSG